MTPTESISVYAPTELSESGFVIPHTRSATAEDELFWRARWYVRDHHPLVMAIVGGMGLSSTAFLAWAFGDGIFSAASAPLIAILAAASLGLFWNYFLVLFSPVKGIGETLLREFPLAEQARKPIAKRTVDGLAVRGIDLWFALVIHMRLYGYR